MKVNCSAIASVLTNKKQTFSIPQFGFGTWRSENNLVGPAVLQAIRQGFRHVDCARIYRNEKDVGKAFTEAFESKIVKREEMFITSKLWTTNMHPKYVRSALETSLRDLNLSYLDLYLIHWPVAWDNTGKWETNDDFYPRHENGMAKEIFVPLEETWAAMEKLVDAGLVKHLGICNALEQHIKKITAVAHHHPVVNQVELHPMWQQQNLKEFCTDRDMLIEAYSPLATPNQYESKAVGLIHHPKVKEIAMKLEMNPAVLLLNWNLQKGNIVLTKSITPAHIEMNASQCFTHALSDEVMKEIDELGLNPKRVLNPDWFHATPKKFFPDG